mmetsp:Transcript_6113/g.14321  ORF Transcript_6113/g.14321 Transcript_6113/m.14321 type:complete len:220 (+) Transcript_6113:3331-3990(+)
MSHCSSIFPDRMPPSLIGFGGEITSTCTALPGATSDMRWPEELFMRRKMSRPDSESGERAYASLSPSLIPLLPNWLVIEFDRLSARLMSGITVGSLAFLARRRAGGSFSMALAAAAVAAGSVAGAIVPFIRSSDEDREYRRAALAARLCPASTTSPALERRPRRGGAEGADSRGKISLTRMSSKPSNTDSRPVSAAAIFYPTQCTSMHAERLREPAPLT